MNYRLKGEHPTHLDLLGMKHSVMMRGLDPNHVTMHRNTFLYIMDSVPAGVGLPSGLDEWMIYGLTLGFDRELPTHLVLFSHRSRAAYSLYNHSQIIEMHVLPTEKLYTILDWLEINKRTDTQVRA